MKYILLMVTIVFLLTGCFGTMIPQRHIVEIKVSSVDKAPVKVETGGKDDIHRSMEIPNMEGSLSNMAFIIKDEAFIKIFSSLTVGDVTRLWNDVVYLLKGTNIRDIHLFINSPGGDAFSGLALTDQIERAKREGFHITAHASGIVASAAVPVFTVCNKRLAAPGTIFMVHETSIWKWPGRETASDIRSQNKLMDLLRDRYISTMAKHTKLSKEQWGEMEYKTTWFSSEKAKEWGVVDEIR